MKITDSVFQLDATKRSHAFLVRGKENFLIDTGMPGLSGQILSEIRQLGVDPADIRAILLTHHDVDHIGNARQLQDATGAGVWAPAEDVPYIAGEKKRPGIKRVIGAVARPRIPAVTGTYGPGWPFEDIRFYRAPGHTPGHTILQFEDVVFAGDLFRYTDGGFRLSSGMMTWDMNEARSSLSVLKSMSFEWVCPAHGSPAHNGRELQNFLG